MSLVAVAVAGIVVLSGCNRVATTSAAAGKVQQGQIADQRYQNAGLQDILSDTDIRFGVLAEPRGDVSDGLYMAVITRVATDAPDPALVIDIISPRSAPGTDSHGWNRYPHLQTAPVAAIWEGITPTLVVVPSGGELKVVSPTEFARVFSGPDAPTGMPYYVELSAGAVSRAWPVAFP